MEFEVAEHSHQLCFDLTQFEISPFGLMNDMIYDYWNGDYSSVSVEMWKIMLRPILRYTFKYYIGKQKNHFFKDLETYNEEINYCESLIDLSGEYFLEMLDNDLLKTFSNSNTVFDNMHKVHIITPGKMKSLKWVLMYDCIALQKLAKRFPRSFFAEPFNESYYVFLYPTRKFIRQMKERKVAEHHIIELEKQYLDNKRQIFDD